MMKELLNLRVALRSDMMTTVRLATGGVCSVAAMSYDDGEDCKVCVTESLLLLMRGGYRAARVAFVWEDMLAVSIEGEGDTEESRVCEDDEIALALINALARDVVMEKRGDGIWKITFTFGKQA